MKKLTYFRFSQKITLFITFVFLFLIFVLMLLEKLTSLSFYFLGVGSLEIFIVLLFCAVFAIMIFWFISVKKIESKLGVGILIVFLFFSSLQVLVPSCVGDYYRIDDPNNSRYIIVRNDSSAFIPSCTVYKPINSFFIKEVAVRQLLKRSHPFKDNTYTIEWSDEEAIISNLPVYKGDDDTIVVNFYD